MKIRHPRADRRSNSRGRRPGIAGLPGFSIEALETRQLLTISLSGIPDWTSQGPGPITMGQTQSTPNNPVDGAVKSVAADPGAGMPNRVIIGTVNGGVWETDDITASSPAWKPLTDQYPSLSIGSVAVSPLDPTGNSLFAGVGRFSSGFGIGGTQDGILRTTNAGSTWVVTKLTSATDQPQVAAVVPSALKDPTTNKQVVLVATNQGLYRSTDSGNSYSLVGVAPSSTTASITDLMPDPSTAGRYYAALPGLGIYRSDVDAAGNVGTTWSQVNGTGSTALAGFSTSPNIKLAVQNVGGNDFVFAGIEGSNGQLFGVYRTATNGVSWNVQGTAPAVNGGSQGAIHFAITADPTTSGVIYVGGDTFPAGSPQFVGNLSVFNPTSSTWSPLSLGGANNTAPHADTRALVFDGANLLDGCDGGIYSLSTPNTAATRSWTGKDGNLQATEFYSVAYDTTNKIIIGGAQDNGNAEQTSTGGVGWQTAQSPVSGLGLVGDGLTQAIDATGPSIVRFSMSDQFNFFVRRTVNGSNVQMTDQQVMLASPATPGTALSGLDSQDTLGVTNNTFDSVPPYVLNSIVPTRMLIGRHGLYEGTVDAMGKGNYGDTINTLTVPGQTNGTRFVALAYGGTTGGIADSDLLFASDNAGHLFIRTTSSGTLTDIAPSGAGTILGIALDPNDWHTVFIVTSNAVYSTVNANTTGTTWTPITGNLASVDRGQGERSIALVKTGGATVALVGGGQGVFRAINPGVTTTWARYGIGLPDVPVTDIHYYGGASDLLLIGTFGRGAWTVANASMTLATPADLVINGDMDFPNENDTIRLALDPNIPGTLDVYLNSSTPSRQIPLATLGTIHVNGLGGNDNLIVDRTNGDPVPLGGISYDGGTHTAPGVDSLSIVGAGASNATFTRDPVIPDAGTLVIGASTIAFVNSQLTNISNVQNLTIVGSNASQGSYSPDGVTADAGTFVVDAATIKFDTVQLITASSINTFVLTTPNAADSAMILPDGIAGNRVSGSSGGVSFTPLSFFGISNVTFDGAKNGQTPFANDSIHIDNPGGQALMALGLQNFTVKTGAGNDVLEVNANDLRLPVSGGLFTFDAGTGILADGTKISNLRGQISLDRVIFTGDEDFLLADKPHVSKSGSAIADDTPTEVDLSLSQHLIGSSLGILTMFGVEAAILTGGSSDNVINASMFSGALIANGVGGNDILIGGSGNNTLMTGAGNSTLIGGNQRTDGAINNILGGGGVNLLIAGPGTNTLIANSGTTTLVGGAGANTFVINNPAGTVLAPIGGYEIVGANNPGDRLILMGGGGKGFNETWIVGPLPDPLAPASIVYPNNLGLDLPKILQPAHFDGEISIAGSFNGTTQPATQAIRYVGIPKVFDSVTASTLTVLAAPGTQQFMSAATVVGSGQTGGITLYPGGVALNPNPFAFANKGKVGLFDTKGHPLPPRFLAIAASQAVTKPATPPLVHAATSTPAVIGPVAPVVNVAPAVAAPSVVLPAVVSVVKSATLPTVPLSLPATSTAVTHPNGPSSVVLASNGGRPKSSKTASQSKGHTHPTAKAVAHPSHHPAKVASRPMAKAAKHHR